MQKVNCIEQTLRKKQAESQTELDILRIKYGNMKTNYRSMEMQQNGLSCYPAASSRLIMRQESSTRYVSGQNRQSCGRDSEVNIGGAAGGIGKQSIDYKMIDSKKLSPLAIHHKLKNMEAKL